MLLDVRDAKVQQRERSCKVKEEPNRPLTATLCSTAPKRANNARSDAVTVLRSRFFHVVKDLLDAHGMDVAARLVHSARAKCATNPALDESHTRTFWSGVPFRDADCGVSETHGGLHGGPSRPLSFRKYQ
jgi:hypothetical protein